MAELITALDEVKLGENLNMEYNWANNIDKIDEIIAQFHFQLTRTSNTSTIDQLEIKYNKLLELIFSDYENTRSSTYIITILKLIAFTRDIISGKGEYNLAYMQICVLYQYAQSSFYKENILEMIKQITTSFVQLNLTTSNVQDHPYGSWKDMKYLCNYHVEKNDRYNLEYKDVLFDHIITLVITQLKQDEYSQNPSLLAKWIPREKSSKFGWINIFLATRYYSNWMTNINDPQYLRAKRKCLTHFRQLISSINKKLNTVQINQCNGTWNKIDFDQNITSITLRKQSKAFLNSNKKGEKYIKANENMDRLKCKENYIQYIDECSKGKYKAKGKRVSMIDFVRDAINLNRNQDLNQANQAPNQANQAANQAPNQANQANQDKLERDILNAQWEENSEQTKSLENCIPMVDTSHSMTDDNFVPLFSAIGLGIRIAQKSKFGKRILTFNSNPTWINLDTCPDFVSMVQKVENSAWGTNTNFRAALDLILNMAIYKNISPDIMKNMSLIILSDMQIDYGMTSSDNTTMFEMMKEKYRAAGMETVYKQPFVLPHIVFWNLRSTQGFPSLCSTQNTSMMSGNNPVILNNFCKMGIGTLKNLTPIKNLKSLLDNERYNHLEGVVNNLFL